MTRPAPINFQIREANQALVLAALGAQELLAAAEQAKARHVLARRVGEGETRRER